jgi:hypothetical protein
MFPSKNDRDGPTVIESGPGLTAGGIDTDDPKAMILHRIHGMHQIGDANDRKVHGRTRGRLDDGRAQWGRVTFRYNDARGTRRFGRTQYRPQIMGVLNSIQNDNQRTIAREETVKRSVFGVGDYSHNALMPDSGSETIHDGASFTPYRYVLLAGEFENVVNSLRSRLSGKVNPFDRLPA